MASLKTQKALKNFLRIVNLPVETSKDGSNVKITLPGLDLNSYRFDGTPHPWAIKKISGVWRLITGDHPNLYFSSKENHKDNEVFVVISSYSHFLPALYLKASIVCPLVLELKPGSIGKSSLSLIETLYHKETNDIMYKSELFLVNFDTINRKAVPFSNEYLEQYGHLFKPFDSMYRVMIPNRDKKLPCFHYKNQAYMSDLDHLFHVTQSKFIKVCTDSISLACKEGFLDNLEDLVVVQTKKVHSGEVFEGDIMDVYVWENKLETEGSNRDISVQIEINNNIVLKAMITYGRIYSLDSKL